MKILKSHIKVARANSAMLRERVWPLPFMPEHIQVAFGRGIFRLLHGNDPRFIYLRDMPMNLLELANGGHPHAWWAYRAECTRTGTVPTV